MDQITTVASSGDAVERLEPAKIIQDDDDDGDEKMRVMVAIDQSEQSLYALQWVLETLVGHVKLTIIHVRHSFPHHISSGLPAVFPTTSIMQQHSDIKCGEENALGLLAHALKMCTDKGVRARTSIVEGDPKSIICDMAEKMRVDLIVTGSRCLGKIKRVIMGSVSDHVIHQAKCPVLVVKSPN